MLEQGRSALADAFGSTYTVAFVLIVLCLIPAFFLPRKKVDSSALAEDEVQPLVAMH